MISSPVVSWCMFNESSEMVSVCKLTKTHCVLERTVWNLMLSACLSVCLSVYMITSESFRSQFKNLKTETHKHKINNVIFKDLKLGLTVRKEGTMHVVYVNHI